MDLTQIPPSWRAALTSGPAAIDASEAQRLDHWLRAQEASGKHIYPPRPERLRALELTPMEQVKVVILGQDPYHGTGQAMGLSFSVPKGVKIPPSLRNIYKELASDCGISPPGHGDLQFWARQGVLLLNTTLTVEAHQAGSHAGKGWEAITDAIIAAIAAQPRRHVFILWGGHAQAKAGKIAALIEPTRHLVLSAPHPSPLSAYRGFFGSKPFSKANDFLSQTGRGTIDWQLPQAEAQNDQEAEGRADQQVEAQPNPLQPQLPLD